VIDPRDTVSEAASVPGSAEFADVAQLSKLIGSRIRTLRGARGWSLSRLAVEAGVGKATLSEIEAGVRNPTLETMYALAGHLGVPLAELLQPLGAQPDPRIELHGAAVSATLLEVFDDPTVTTEFYRLLVRPGQRQISPAHGTGVTEHLLVTAGAILVGPVSAPMTVRSGGHVRWESSADHLWEVIGSEPVQAALVIRHPRAGREPSV
jgi:XRE family transcriptional regulator, regulator of sulfur utilization